MAAVYHWYIAFNVRGGTQTLTILVYCRISADMSSVPHMACVVISQALPTHFSFVFSSPEFLIPHTKFFWLFGTGVTLRVGTVFKNLADKASPLVFCPEDSSWNDWSTLKISVERSLPTFTFQYTPKKEKGEFISEHNNIVYWYQSVVDQSDWWQIANLDNWIAYMHHYLTFKSLLFNLFCQWWLKPKKQQQKKYPCGSYPHELQALNSCFI